MGKSNANKSNTTEKAEKPIDGNNNVDPAGATTNADNTKNGGNNETAGDQKVETIDRSEERPGEQPAPLEPVETGQASTPAENSRETEQQPKPEFRIYDTDIAWACFLNTFVIFEQPLIISGTGEVYNNSMLVLAEIIEISPDAPIAVLDTVLVENGMDPSMSGLAVVETALKVFRAVYLGLKPPIVEDTTYSGSGDGARGGERRGNEPEKHGKNVRGERARTDAEITRAAQQPSKKAQAKAKSDHEKAEAKRVKEAAKAAKDAAG